MYGRGPLGARRFCTKSARRDVIDTFLMKNALLSFVVASREKVSVLWGNQEKNQHSQCVLIILGVPCML